MMANPDLLAGAGIPPTPVHASNVKAKYYALSKILKHYGPYKTIEQWKHTWRDLVRKIRVEKQKNNGELSAQGQLVMKALMNAKKFNFKDTESWSKDQFWIKVHNGNTVESNSTVTNYKVEALDNNDTVEMSADGEKKLNKVVIVQMENETEDPLSGQGDDYVIEDDSNASQNNDQDESDMNYTDLNETSDLNETHSTAPSTLPMIDLTMLLGHDYLQPDLQVSRSSSSPQIKINNKYSSTNLTKEEKKTRYESENYTPQPRNKKKEGSSHLTEEEVKETYEAGKYDRDIEVLNTLNKFIEYEQERDKLHHEREMTRIKQTDKLISVIDKIADTFVELAPSIKNFLDRDG